MRGLLGVCLLAACASSANAANMYMCRDAGGKLSIQDDACPAGSSAKIIPVPKSSQASNTASRSSTGSRLKPRTPVRPVRTSSAKTQIKVCDQLWQEKGELDGQSRDGMPGADRDDVLVDLQRIGKELCRQDCHSCPEVAGQAGGS